MKPKVKEVTVPESVEMIQPIKITGNRKFYKENPFLAASSGFYIETRKQSTIVGGDLSLVDRNNSPVSMAIIGQVKEVDTENYVKFYTEHIGAVLELPKTARYILHCIILAVQEQAVNRAEIHLPYDKAREYYEKAGKKAPVKSTFLKGIQDLVNAHIIAYHRYKSWYWTNPKLMFNGNRVSFLQSYVNIDKVKKTQIPTQHSLPGLEERNPFEQIKKEETSVNDFKENKIPKSGFPLHDPNHDFTQYDLHIPDF